jgi:hypothetical protein
MAEDGAGAVRAIAANKHVGRTCPYCRFPLKEGTELALCSHCRAAHHLDCWSDNGGCAVLGCAGAPTVGAAGRAPSDQELRMPRSMAGADARSTSGPLPLSPLPMVPHGVVRPPVPPTSSRGRSTTRELAAALGVLAVAIGGVAVAIVVSNRHQNVPAIRNAAARPAFRSGAAPARPQRGVTASAAGSQAGATASSAASPSSGGQQNGTAGTSSSSTSTAPQGTGTTATASELPGAQAVAWSRRYWSDIDNGDYSAAEAMEGGAETGYDAFARSKPMV